MLRPVHPEALAPNWLPPVSTGRQRPVADLARLLRFGPGGRAPPLAWLDGPEGSGTSTVAHLAARAVVEEGRVALPPVEIRAICVRTRWCGSALGVAAELLRHFDAGFDAHGFSIAEILAGFLRRLHRDGRPALVVLDDIDIGGPELARIVRALASPERFLPEGESGVPPIGILLSGRRAGFEAIRRALGARLAWERHVELGAYSGTELAAIVRDRLERSLGRPAPEGLAEGIVARALRDGHGAVRALDLLRRELFGPAGLRPGLLRSRLGAPPPLLIEARVVRALARAAQEESVPLRDIRRWETMLARAEGSRPLPTTTFWRRIVRLEQAGYVRREIRTGGMGGTRSTLRLLSPIGEWVTAPPGPGTPRAFGWAGERREPGAAPARMGLGADA